MQRPSIALLLSTIALSACTALTNFGEFIFEDAGQNPDLAGADLTGADLTDPPPDLLPGPDLNCGAAPKCDDARTLRTCAGTTTCSRCVPSTAVSDINGNKLDIPAHCAPVVSNVDPGLVGRCFENGAGAEITFNPNAKLEIVAQGTEPSVTGVDSKFIWFNDKVMLVCARAIVGKDIEIHTTPGRAIVFAADGIIDLSGTIDVSGDPQNSDAIPGGPGGSPGGKPGSSGQVTGDTGGVGGNPSDGTGGGGGGGNGQAGGAGGAVTTNGTKRAAGGKLSTSISGGGGGGGGLTQISSEGGVGGGGGGGLEFSAGFFVRIASAINATGEVGLPGTGAPAGTTAVGGSGGGGGAGGTIWLEAPGVFLNRACLSVYGGAGGNGAIGNISADKPNIAASCPFASTPGNAGTKGGDPRNPSMMAAFNGANGDAPKGAGAGGGAGAPGRVIVRSINDLRSAASDFIFPTAALDWAAYAQ